MTTHADASSFTTDPCAGLSKAQCQGGFNGKVCRWEGYGTGGDSCVNIAHNFWGPPNKQGLPPAPKGFMSALDDGAGNIARGVERGFEELFHHGGAQTSAPLALPTQAGAMGAAVPTNSAEATLERMMPDDRDTYGRDYCNAVCSANGQYAAAMQPAGAGVSAQCKCHDFM